MANGWIKLHRKLTESPLWKGCNDKQKVLMIYFMLKANHEENRWIYNGQEYSCKPGQFITSLRSLSKETGYTIQTIRSALDKFKKHDFSTQQTTHENTLVTLVNWELYQINSTEQHTEQQSNNTATTPNKNDKRNKKNDIAHPNFEEILSLYGQHCAGLPKVLKLSEKRKRILKAWGDLEEMEEVFIKAGKSDFLTGSKGWTANFDWIINPENRLKILEGGYDNKQPSQQQQPQQKIYKEL